MDAGEDTWAFQPERFTGEIIGGDDDIRAVEKGAEDAFAIACGGGGGVAILAVEAFGGCFDHRLLPKELAIGAIKTEKETFLGF